MQYTETQLEAIRLFGKEDLTEGCIVRKEKGKWFKIANISDIKYPDGKTYYKQAKGYGVHGKFYQPKFKTELDFEILGHEVHLEDLFRLAEEKGLVTLASRESSSIYFKEGAYMALMADIPYDFLLPLLDQPEETLTQLCNLFR